MKKSNLLNPDLCAAVAALGHTEYIVIADCGLPLNSHIKTIDLSVTAGLPCFVPILESIEKELVIESYICATEAQEKNPALLKEVERILPYATGTYVSHEEFKKLTEKAKYVVRTGENSPYANIILVGGVNF